jgi:hypothetical protein
MSADVEMVVAFKALLFAASSRLDVVVAHRKRFVNLI